MNAINSNVKSFNANVTSNFTADMLKKDVVGLCYELSTLGKKGKEVARMIVDIMGLHGHTSVQTFLTEEFFKARLIIPVKTGGKKGMSVKSFFNKVSSGEIVADDTLTTNYRELRNLIELVSYHTREKKEKPASVVTESPAPKGSDVEPPAGESAEKKSVQEVIVQLFGTLNKIEQSELLVKLAALNAAIAE